MSERYRFPVDKLVNRLVPHYLSGRRFILIVQSMLYPLQALAERFVSFAREKHIEARMTSQAIYFEWYLNYKFNKYFLDSKDRIRLEDSVPLGIDLYHEESRNVRPYTLWYEGEQIIVGDPAEEPRPMYLRGEEKSINQVSFRVCVPAVSISQQEMVSMITFVVDTYRTAGKTYLIQMEASDNKSSNDPIE